MSQTPPLGGGQPSPATPDGPACLGAEEVTRDFAYGEADPLVRRCMLLPWAPTDLLDVSSHTPEPPADHYQVGLPGLPPLVSILHSSPGVAE